MQLYIQENHTQGQTLSELCQKLLNCTDFILFLFTRPEIWVVFFNGLPLVMYTVAI